MCVTGRCLYFDGTKDNYLSIPDSDSLDKSSSFSIVSWIKLAADLPNDRLIVRKSINDNNDNYVLELNSSEKLSCGFGVTLKTSNNKLDINKWYFIECVFNDDENKIEIYVNGNLDSSFDSVTGTPPVNNDDLYIGSYYSIAACSGYCSSFPGFIDEVKIYPYARTADQIRQDYAAGLAGNKSNSGVAASFGSKSDSWMTDGLVGYWKFDEPSIAGTYADSSGNGNTGTADGNASTTAGKFGNASVFDGSGDDIVASDDLLGTGAITICAWAKVDTMSNGIGYGITGNGVTLFDYHQSGGVRYLVFSSDFCNEECLTSDGNDILLNTWQHVCAVRDENSRATLYIDGVISGEKDRYSGDPYTYGFSTAIGAIRDDPISPFDGQLDEVRIYNRALSADEVRKLYEWAPGPVAWWKFDELAGTTAYDSAASTTYSGGNDGIISGGATSFPTTAVLDNFNRTNEGPPPSASWSNYLNGLSVYNNTVVRGSGSENISYWNEDMGLDQEAYFTFNAAPVISMGVVLKFDPTAGTGYVVYRFSGNGNIYIGRLTDNSTDVIYTRCNTTTATCDRVDYFSGGSFAAGDSLGAHIDAAGHITVYKKSGGTWTEIGNATDSTYTGGKIGLQIISNSTVAGALADNFGGGNAAGAPPEPALGKFGGAIEFDGNDNAVTVPPSAKLSPGNGSWTASAWAKPADENQLAVLVLGYSERYDPDYPQWGMIFANSTMDGAGKKLWGVFQESESSPIYRFSHSTADQIDGSWHYYSMTADKAADEVRLFVDGLEIAKTAVNTGAWPDVDTSVEVTNIGDVFGVYNFKGQIDDVRVYNYARTQKQILEDMGNGPALNQPVLHLTFDEGYGDTAYDSSVFKNNGTLYPVGSGSNDTVSQMWDKGGKFGGAMEFDGENDYISIANLSVNGSDNGHDLMALLDEMGWRPEFNGILWDNGANIYFYQDCFGFNTGEDNVYGIPVAAWIMCGGR